MNTTEKLGLAAGLYLLVAIPIAIKLWPAYRTARSQTGDPLTD